MEHVWYAIELLRSDASGAGTFALTDASEFLDGLMSGKEAVKRVLDLNGEQNRVHRANLHKVKGLEAPIVILAQLRQRDRLPAIHMETDGPSQKRWVLRLAGPGFQVDTGNIQSNSTAPCPVGQGAFAIQRMNGA